MVVSFDHNAHIASLQDVISIMETAQCSFIYVSLAFAFEFHVLQGKCYIGVSQLSNQRGLFAREALKGGFTLSEKELIQAAQLAPKPDAANAILMKSSFKLKTTKTVKQFDEIFLNEESYMRLEEKEEKENIENSIALQSSIFADNCYE